MTLESKYKQAAHDMGDLFCWCVEHLKKFSPREGAWLDEVKQRLLDGEPFRPMSLEECEAALDAVADEDCKPMTDEQIEHGVKYATDAAYRAEWLKTRHDEQCRINRGLREEVNRLKDFYNEVSAALANEGPHTIEHLLATACLGKQTTVIGRARLKQLADAEQEVERLTGIIRNVIRGKWSVTDLQEAIGELTE